MPKRSTKRSIDERISEYHKKIEELKQKKNREPPRKRIRIIYSSSDEDCDNQDNVMPNSHHDESHSEMHEDRTSDPISPGRAPCDQSQVEIHNHAPEANPRQEQEPADSPVIIEPEVEQLAGTFNETVAAVPSTPMEAPVEPDLLTALGESTDDTPEFGKPIHENLATLWLPLLKKGLPKENKDKLLKNNLVPENCKLLHSPKLNAEISAAVSDIVRGRDKKLAGFQQQLGAGITAVNKGMEILLNSGQKAQALAHFSDGCRILTDLHCVSTKDRIKLITPSLEKNILHVIQDSERDDTLFGNTLSEKIKAGKAITRQGQQIKKTQVTTSTFRQPTVNRYTPPGNWRGPPRYYTSRGGRGNQTRPVLTRRQYHYNTTSTAKPAAQTKPRAPTQQ